MPRILFERLAPLCYNPFMKTDTTEKGLETLIMRHMTGTDGLASGATGVVADAGRRFGGNGWYAVPFAGHQHDSIQAVI